MKKIIFAILTSIFTMTHCLSQDIVTKKSGEDIQAKILEVTTTEVKYKKSDNLNGPTYSILKSEVVAIVYQNGTKDSFAEIDNEKNQKSVPISDSFYVEKTSEGYEQAIIDKLLKLKRILATKQEMSSYTIKCIISKNGGWGVPAEGSIVILETKTGRSLLASKSAKGMVSMFRGFQNPRFIIMNKIASDYLSDLLLQLDNLK